MYVLLFHNFRLNQQSAISNQQELHRKGRKDREEGKSFRIPFPLRPSRPLR